MSANDRLAWVIVGASGAVAILGSWAVAEPSGKRAAEHTPEHIQAQSAPEPMPSTEDRAALIANAISAAPPHIARDAAVAMPAPDGTLETLRAGTNDFTCMPDDPRTPGNDPMCANQQGLQWVRSWARKEPRPGNSEPGIAYMLQGGSELSATDPWATSSARPIESPPHWMLLWPFTPNETGLPTQPQKTGTWIMWAGTPYAHLMVNQNPIPERPTAAREKTPGPR